MITFSHYVHPLYRLAYDKRTVLGPDIRELFFQFERGKIWLFFHGEEDPLRLRFRRFDAAQVWEVEIVIRAGDQQYDFSVSKGESSHDLKRIEAWTCTLTHPENHVESGTPERNALIILDAAQLALGKATCVSRG